MRALVISGDIYHPTEVVVQGLNALSLMQSGSLQLEFLPDTEHWQAGKITDFDAVILCKGNSKSPTNMSTWLTEEIQGEFASFVENGGGLLVIHAGTVGYNNQPIFQHLIGGAFKHHPKPGPVEMHIKNSADLSNLASQNFTVHDEHYWMKMFHDDLDIFMTSQSENVTHPAGWTRKQGAGRVCVLTPGHYIDVWLHPVYQTIIEQALLWCARP